VWTAPCPVALPHHARSAAWNGPVASLGTATIPCVWLVGPALHYSRLSTSLAGIKYVACKHVLQAHYGPDVWRIRNMCTCVGNIEPSCIGRFARLFFMFDARGPQRTIGHVVSRSPQCREVGSRAAGHVAHRSPPNGSRAMVHMVVPEPFLLGRQDLDPLDTWCTEALSGGSEPWYMWQRRSPSYQGGGIWIRWTHGSFRAHLGWEAGSGTAGRVVAHGCMPHSLS
jgi:hypothetical protein